MDDKSTKPNSGGRRTKSGQRFTAFFIEAVQLYYTYFLFFAAVVLGFAYTYQRLTPIAQGIGQAGKSLSEVSFANAVYFSVVTVSTLGYGDMHPVGWSKAIVCLEVLFGLTFFGVVIAKVTSRRLTYHVQKLYSSHSEKQIEDYASSFERLATELRQLMGLLAQLLQTTPSEPSGPSPLAIPLIARFGAALIDFDFKSKSLSRYLAAEVKQGAYFAIVPPETMRRLGNSIDASLHNLGLLILSLPPTGRVLVLDVDNRDRINTSLETHRTVCALVQTEARDEELLACFRRLLVTCDQLPASFFSVPTEPETTAQPDQILSVGDQPPRTSAASTAPNTEPNPPLPPVHTG